MKLNDRVVMLQSPPSLLKCLWGMSLLRQPIGRFPLTLMPESPGIKVFTCRQNVWHSDVLLLTRWQSKFLRLELKCRKRASHLLMPS